MAAPEEVAPLRPFVRHRCASCPAYEARKLKNGGSAKSGTCHMDLPDGGGRWKKVKETDWCMNHPENLAQIQGPESP